MWKEKKKNKCNYCFDFELIAYGQECDKQIYDSRIYSITKRKKIETD